MAAGSSPVMIQLQNRELWERFREAGTEMVITKQGRCMFPVIRLNFSGLVPICHYALVMDFVIAKESKRKFIQASSSWTAAMPADFSPIEGSYVHPGTPAKGFELMDSTVSFHKLKLSNRFHASSQVVTLKSMHAYIPRLHVYQTPYGYQGEWYHVTSFVLRQAEFVAVTSYNNQTVCKLKIDNNPFAKAFRKADVSSAKRQRLDLASRREETSSRNPASGTSYTGESPLDQLACEESLTSGDRTGNGSPYCQDMCVVIPTSGPFSWDKYSEGDLSLKGCSGAVTEERMICLADSTCMEEMGKLSSGIRGPKCSFLNSAIEERRGRNDTYSYEVQCQPGEHSIEPTVVTDSGFPSGNLPLNGINSLESFCSQVCSRFDTRERSGSDPCGDPTVATSSGRTCENQSSTEGQLTEKRDSEEPDCLQQLAPSNLSRRRRRKATPRRLRKDSDCQTTSRIESPKLPSEKPEKGRVDQQLQEVQGISKIQDVSEGECQNIVEEESQECQDTPEERLQEMQSVLEEQPQKMQDASSEQNKDREEKSDLCDVMWLTSLGSTMNVDDGNSLKRPGSGLKILDLAAPAQLTTAPGDDSQPHTSQVPVTMTSIASCSLVGDVSESIAMQSQVMETSKSPMALHVTSSNVHVTAEETETNQSAAGSLGHVMSGNNTNHVKSHAPSTMDEAPPIPSAAQEGKVTRDTEFKSYFSFADVLRNPTVVGLNENRDISERNAVMPMWNTQTSLPGRGVSTQYADHVTQAQTPAETRRSLPVSNSWPVVVSVYSQQSSETGREADARPRPLNLTPVESTTAIPITYEGNRNLTEDIANTPQWSSSEKVWSVSGPVVNTMALPTANEGNRNLPKVILSEAQESCSPVVLRSYSLQNQIGQQHSSDGAVFQKGIARVQMPSQSYGRDVLNLSRKKAGVMEVNSFHKSACFPVALEACYSFRVSRPEEATVQRPYLSNRYYRPTRTIFSRFSLEPRCSVLPSTPVPSTRYGWWTSPYRSYLKNLPQP